MKYLLIILLSLVAGSPAFATDIVDKLQAISVTIKSGGSSGSGVLFTREDGEECRTYVWTAAHVCDNLRDTREVIIKGDKKMVVEFGDAAIVSEFHQDGRRIGEMKLDARVVRYSDSENGEDLCLLEVRKRNFVPLETSVEFYDGELPKIGTKLLHVGSLLGQTGANSLTSGLVSQNGRVLDLGANGKVFTQSTCTAFPGSSGGGVFLEADGRCVGLLVRGSGESFNFYVPHTRIRQWAKDAQVEWAIDRDVPMPSEDDMRKLPVEDASSDSIPLSQSGSVEYPFLLAQPGLTPVPGAKVRWMPSPCRCTPQ
jgi:S1-C subfamily serine protease